MDGHWAIDVLWRMSRSGHTDPPCTACLAIDALASQGLRAPRIGSIGPHEAPEVAEVLEKPEVKEPRYMGDAHLNCCIRCGTALVYVSTSHKMEPAVGCGELTNETCGATDDVRYCPVCGLKKRSRCWTRWRTGATQETWFDKDGKVFE